MSADGGARGGGSGGGGRRGDGRRGPGGKGGRGAGGPRRGRRNLDGRERKDKDKDEEPRGGERRGYDGVVTWEPSEDDKPRTPRRRRGAPDTAKPDAAEPDAENADADAQHDGDSSDTRDTKPDPPSVQRHEGLRSGLVVNVGSTKPHASGPDAAAPADAAVEPADDDASPDRATNRARARTWFAACALGVEQALVDELVALGAEDVVSQPGGARFAGPLEVGYRACLWLRCAVRVQEILVRDRAPDQDAVYDLIHDLPWEDLIGNAQTLAVDASVRDAALTHSGFAAQLVKDAVVDRCRVRTGARPSVDRKRPDLPLKLRLHGDDLVLSRDLTGASLHKRGYRPIQVKSPLNEALAAGLLALTEWRGEGVLADPMCGSGTLLIEAAHRLGDVAPGWRRRFACERWRDADGQLLARLREEATRRAAEGALGLVDNHAHPTDAVPLLLGADRHPGALALARRAVTAAGLDGVVRLGESDVAQWTPRARPHTVVCNPPYGERLGEGDDLTASWRALGDFLRTRCAGGTAWLLSGAPELTRALGLRASRKLPVRNGPIACRWLRYALDV